jgi:hypothetical protein
MTRLRPEGEPVEVWGDEEDPEGFIIHRVGAHPMGVHRIDVWNRWRIHARWWASEQPTWREYLRVTTDTGLLCLLYRDLINGGWYLARVYD